VSRALKYDIPGVDWRLTPDCVRERVREAGWPGIFAPELSAPARLVVDVGFGRGECLLVAVEGDEQPRRRGEIQDRGRVAPPAHSAIDDDVAGTRARVAGKLADLSDDGHAIGLQTRSVVVTAGPRSSCVIPMILPRHVSACPES